MTNYNEKIKKASTVAEIEVILEEHKNDILNNVECVLTEKAIGDSLKKINENFEKAFSADFVQTLNIDRKTAFTNLLTHPTFDKYVLTANENGTFSIEKKTALFKFSTLEKAYQLSKSDDDKPNKEVTIFGALRYYGCCEAFIRNMLIGNLSVDNENKIEIAKVKIDNQAIFEDDNGKTFGSNSNNALEKQLNILVKFYGLDVHMLKKDLPLLKLSAQKIKRDKTTNKASIKEVDTLKFTDIIFSVVTSRANNEDVKVYLSNGNEIGKVEE